MLDKRGTLDSGEFKRKVSERKTVINLKGEKEKEVKPSGFGGGNQNRVGPEGEGREWSSEEEKE